MDSGNVIYSGYLKKSPPERKLWQTWQKRYFVLRSNKTLTYYQNKLERRPLKDPVDLSQCLSIVANAQHNNISFKYVFSIITKTRTYYLVADSQKEMDTWVKHLCRECGIENKDGKLSPDPTSTPNSPPPAYSEMPTPYTPGPIGHAVNAEPSVICRVCQQIIYIRGREQQGAVNCANCQEATPIKPPPLGEKYILCPCNALLICKVTSTRISCSRPNCKRIINLAPRTSSVPLTSTTTTTTTVWSTSSPGIIDANAMATRTMQKQYTPHHAMPATKFMAQTGIEGLPFKINSKFEILWKKSGPNVTGMPKLSSQEINANFSYDFVQERTVLPS